MKVEIAGEITWDHLDSLQMWVGNISANVYGRFKGEHSSSDILTRDCASLPPTRNFTPLLSMSSNYFFPRVFYLDAFYCSVLIFRFEIEFYVIMSLILMYRKFNSLQCEIEMKSVFCFPSFSDTRETGRFIGWNKYGKLNTWKYILKKYGCVT